MREVLQGLLIAGVVAWGVCVLAVLWMRHRLRRDLRISPSVRSAAPTVWLVSHTQGARLHRRLRRVGAAARAASALDPALRALAEELVSDALALEPGVVSVARTGRTGSSVRRGLSARISELESVAQHLTRLSTERAHEAGEVIRLRDRVTALEAARQELADIDLRAGLVTRT